MSAAGDYYDGPWGPTRSALAFADSPLGLFFYFLPKQLWIRIAEESNRYRTQLIPELAQQRREALLKQQAKDPRKSVPPLAELDAEFRLFKPIKPHEIVHVMALLMARAIAPVRDGLSKHWATSEDGAVPRGTFSRYMKRARFEAITRFLHFNNNEAAQPVNDKAWKIRGGEQGELNEYTSVTCFARILFLLRLSSKLIARLVCFWRVTLMLSHHGCASRAIEQLTAIAKSLAPQEWTQRRRKNCPVPSTTSPS
ncbi:unnamed protein product [Phytophthora fragariaefolia]|uniref:Unnamed protein product n=1 Tax=Phytophthora fragariaefolia TaxID=1490495 RepID=A0A9W6YDQ4_9STRA|nr:unnamed protein product [Phytophthora fragariaefolia]